MSKDSSNEQSGDKDISRIAAKSNHQRNYEGFEGMNYEQFRQPYNPKHKNRNNSAEERRDGNRPDDR